MKKIKFIFSSYTEPEISEIFEFDESEPEYAINEVFEEWFINELDRHGIEGYFEEID